MDPEMSGAGFTVEEFDIDFEYDAPRFYDFSRPESDSETKEAELWFERSGDYPPSRFSLLSNWRNDFLEQFISNNGDYKTGETRNPNITSLNVGLDREDKYNGFIYYNETVSDVPSTKPKSRTKSTVSRVSTLTKPTASLLARQNKPLDTYSTQLLRRCQRSLGKLNDKISSLLHPRSRNQDTERRKMEAGFFCKAGCVNSNGGRAKVTVPREPNLQTAQRARSRHRFKLNSEEPEQQNAKLNSASSKSQPTEKYAFHQRTSLKASQRSPNAKSATPDDSTRENDTTHSQMLKSHDPSTGGKLKGIRSMKTTPKAYGSEIWLLDSKTSNKAVDMKHENSFPKFIQGVRRSTRQGLLR
ncbi:PREDICTED: uncharacterized protein LOC104818265 isoform X2 [Tarenaya hassleriana]|uniref:uncharacterized protein LOC104818265 isoform X2 n=1 Tax=Tarenaya hassleriana TaxID=28532 RepID=UPI00053C3D48|nr:PREDICTED: uncharacterized protein LOC104818265 isoform X2 [Tarenaya hassleriana]